MNAHQFAKLTKRQKLEHITLAKRCTVKQQTEVTGTQMDLATGYRCFLRGIAIGQLHSTKEAALEAGRSLLKKFRAEAKQLGIQCD